MNAIGTFPEKTAPPYPGPGHSPPLLLSIMLTCQAVYPWNDLRRWT